MANKKKKKKNNKPNNQNNNKNLNEAIDEVKEESKEVLNSESDDVKKAMPEAEEVNEAVDASETSAVNIGEEKTSENENSAANESADEEYERIKAERLNKAKLSSKTLLGLFIAAVVVILCIVFAFNKFKGKNEKSDEKQYEVKLGQYIGLSYNASALKISDEDVQAEIDALIESKISYTKVEDRNEVMEGDIVNCDYTAVIGDEEIESDNTNFEIGSGQIADLENALIGKFITSDDAEPVIIKATVPENYKGIEKLEGHDGEEVTFTVVIKLISRRNIPVIDDEFAIHNSDGECQKGDEFFSYMKKKMEDEAREKSEDDIWKELIGKIIETSEFINIDGEVNKQYETIYSTYKSHAEKIGVSMDEYATQFYDVSLDELKDTLKESVEEIVKEQLVLDEIFKEEKMEITDELYDKYMKQYLSEYGFSDADTFVSFYGEDSVELNMKCSMAIDFILDKAVAN